MKLPSKAWELGARIKLVGTSLTGYRENRLKIVVNSKFEFVDTENRLPVP
jgi:hypothetical protein